MHEIRRTHSAAFNVAALIKPNNPSPLYRRKFKPSPLLGLVALVAAFASSVATFSKAAAQDFVDQPEDQMVFLSQNATFTAGPKLGDLSFQWLRQWADHAEVLAGQTTSSLTLTNVSLKDVGQYLCAVMRGDEIQLTHAVSLTVCVSSGSTATGAKSSLIGAQSVESQSFGTLDYGGGTLTLFGSPVVSSGSSGSCPGAYAGYVNYTKTVSQGWGWAPTAGATVHTATDANRTDTKVEYVGKYGDKGCDQATVTIPHPTYSPKYRFSIYFPNNVPSTNAYAITLAGFDP